MKFKLLESLLTEGKNYAQTVNNYSNKLDKDTIELVLNQDPTYTGGSTTGKYGEWMLQKVADGSSIDTVVNAVDLFNSSINIVKNKDITSYKTPEDVVAAVNEAKPTERQRQRAARHSFAECNKLFETENLELWEPLSWYGAQTLGRGTQWCTADSRTAKFYVLYAGDYVDQDYDTFDIFPHDGSDNQDGDIEEIFEECANEIGDCIDVEDFGDLDFETQLARIEATCGSYAVLIHNWESDYVWIVNPEEDVIIEDNVLLAVIINKYTGKPMYQLYVYGMENGECYLHSFADVNDAMLNGRNIKFTEYGDEIYEIGEYLKDAFDWGENPLEEFKE